MAKIDTWSALFAKIEKDVVDAMNDMDKDSNWKNDNNNPKYVMMQYVDSEVYGTFDPLWYENTWALRDSIKASNAQIEGDVVEVGLYHDTDMMSKLHDPEYPRYGSDSDISDILPDIIEGEYKWGANKVFPKTGEWRRKTWYQKKTADDLRSGRFKKWLKRQLIKKGYRVV